MAPQAQDLSDIERFGLWKCRYFEPFYDIENIANKAFIDFVQGFECKLGRKKEVVRADRREEWREENRAVEDGASGRERRMCVGAGLGQVQRSGGGSLHLFDHLLPFARRSAAEEHLCLRVMRSREPRVSCPNLTFYPVFLS
ncbi:hypothetical protein J6590_003851 [Homalodisca vitripennis]|nr:hypothetical protein J6590_003851 [Homalodisca vitripennis]